MYFCVALFWALYFYRSLIEFSINITISLLYYCSKFCYKLCRSKFATALEPFKTTWKSQKYHNPNFLGLVLGPTKPQQSTTRSISLSTPSAQLLGTRNPYTEKITVVIMEVGDLPGEIILKILHYLRAEDSYQVCRVNRRLYALFSSPSLWRHYCATEYGTRVPPLLARHTYQHYLCRFGYKTQNRDTTRDGRTEGRTPIRVI